MGVPFFPLTNNRDGTIPLEAIGAAVKPDNVHLPRTKLVALENTQNRCGGRVLTAQYMAEVAALCKSKGLALHVDGARIMNAAVALGVDPGTLLEGADSACVCLSKGLGAPVGSVLLGSTEFISKVGAGTVRPTVRPCHAASPRRRVGSARPSAAACVRQASSLPLAWSP